MPLFAWPRKASAPRKIPSAPPRPRVRGWVGAAYGARAEALVGALRERMDAAADEAMAERGSAFDPVPEGHASRRTLLEVELIELRSLILNAKVSDEDHDRDLRLRASLSVAIGAARSLALASPSQPTIAYLRVTKAAIDDVLIAADQ